MRIIPAFTVFLASAFSATVDAQTFGDIGTRAEGMGGAFVAMADDASAAFWNPAGLATGPTFDFQVSVARESIVFVGMALPVLGITYYRTHQLTGLSTVSPPPDRENGGSGEVPIRPLTTSNVGASVVQTIVPGLVIGTTVRLVSGSIEPFDGATTVDLDAGAMVSVSNVRFGLTARNILEPEFERDFGAVRMARQFRVGAAFAPRSLPMGVHGPYSLAIDADLTRTPGVSGAVRMVATGGEYWVAQGRFGVRGGVRWSILGDSRCAFSGGFTLRLKGALYAEGQMTKHNESDEEAWNIGARATF